jgi:hypothetical protein
LVDLLSFYAAHALAVLLALGIIWVHHDLPPVLLTLVVLFAIIAVGIPLTILRLNRRGSRIMALLDTPPPFPDARGAGHGRRASGDPA